MRRRRYATQRAVPALQDLAKPAGRLLALPDGNQRPRDIADHVHEEGVGRDVHRDPVTDTLDTDRSHVAYGRIRLAAGRTKGRKIVLADYLLGRLVHEAGVERLVHPPGALTVKRRALQAIENPVAVMSAGRGEARVELVADPHHPGHADIGREVGIDAEQPATVAALGHGVEMNDLPRRVDARIRPAGTGDLDVLVGHDGKRLLEALLHTDAVFLALPAVVRRAVVFDAERNAHDDRECRPAAP